MRKQQLLRYPKYQETTEIVSETLHKESQDREIKLKTIQSGIPESPSISNRLFAIKAYQSSAQPGWEIVSR